MLVLGLQGSPKKKGSSDYLLKAFMAEIEKMGVDTHIVDIPRKNIKPCIGCGYCEKHGFCVTEDDDMARSMYALIRQAEVIIAASPVFFYSVTAQLKALIDRSQALWSRKYRYRLSDPLSTSRKGIFLSMGGSRGKKLFDGIHLVATYFFDAVDAAFSGSLTYPGIETRTDFHDKPQLDQEIAATAQALMSSLLSRKRILFVGKHDDIRTQIAAALTQFQAGIRLEVKTAGVDPVASIHPGLMEVMADIGIDMAYRPKPSSMENIATFQPHHVIVMNADIEVPRIPGTKFTVWDLPDPHNITESTLVPLREQIRENIDQLIQIYSNR